MKNYLIDRMVVASPRFEKARQLRSSDDIQYTIIEEICWESRHDKVNAEKIKKETSDNISAEYIENLIEIVPEMIEAGVLKLNEGCGDAMLVAEYLTTGKGEQGDLFEQDTDSVVVTRDRGLTDYCKNKKIEIITEKEFFAICLELGE